jgi:ribosomal protein L25 (general stress protein Ctc)
MKRHSRNSSSPASRPCMSRWCARPRTMLTRTMIRRGRSSPSRRSLVSLHAVIAQQRPFLHVALQRCDLATLLFALSAGRLFSLSVPSNAPNASVKVHDEQEHVPKEEQQHLSFAGKQLQNQCCELERPPAKGMYIHIKRLTGQCIETLPDTRDSMQD